MAQAIRAAIIAAILLFCGLCIWLAITSAPVEGEYSFCDDNPSPVERMNCQQR